MTINTMCPSRETRKVERLAAGAVESLAGVRKRERQEHRSMPVQ
jgi:hypothetical protein